jgi:membrane protein implicated in regulation of membrane protease activity
MLNRYWFCCVLAALTVWMVEGYGMAIAHSSGRIGLVILFCPGMLLAFFGLFENVYLAWAVAVVLSAAYYLLIWEVVRELRKRQKNRNAVIPK